MSLLQRLPPQPDQKRYLQFQAAETPGVDPRAKTIDAIVSTINKDRMDEIILPSAFAKRLDLYLRNPQMLWSHNPDIPDNIIGRAAECRIVPNHGLRALFDCSGAYEVNPRAKLVFDLFEKRLLNAFSVGFFPIKWIVVSDPARLPDEVKEELGDVDITGVTIIYTEVELVEISACAIPANRESLVVGRSIDNLEEVLMEILQQAKAAEATWKVCGSRSLDVSDKDEWDKSKAQESLGDDLALWSKAHVLCLGDGSEKGHFHLPFAMKVGDELKAIKGGVQACAGAHGIDAVNGVPDDVRERAKSFTEAYYHKFDEKAPWEDKKDAQAQRPLLQRDHRAGAAPVAKRHPQVADIGSRLYACADTIIGDMFWEPSSSMTTPDPKVCLGVIKILNAVIADIHDLAGTTPDGEVSIAGAGSAVQKSGKVLSDKNVKRIKKCMGKAAEAVGHCKAVLDDAGAEYDDPYAVPPNNDEDEDDDADKPNDDEDNVEKVILVP